MMIHGILDLTSNECDAISGGYVNRQNAKLQQHLKIHQHSNMHVAQCVCDLNIEPAGLHLEQCTWRVVVHVHFSWQIVFATSTPRLQVPSFCPWPFFR
jgi:hypothetical protein